MGKRRCWTEEEMEILKELVNKQIPHKVIAEKLGRTTSAITTRIAEMSLDGGYKNSSSFKAIYQDYDWCYDRYVNRRMSMQEMANELGVKKRVVQKWCFEKHNIKRKPDREIIKLNDLQRKLIVVSMIGDGHIDKRKEEPNFIVSHAENQRDYLYWKYDILKDLCNKPPSVVKPKIRVFNGKDYHCQKIYRINTKIIDELKPIRDLSRYNIIQSLDGFQLSILMLDDGHRSNSNWQICVASFSEEDKDLFINVCKDKFKLNANLLNNDSRYILFDADSSRQIDRIILENIPNNLDVVQYKIINKQITSPAGYIFIETGNGDEVSISNYFKEHNISLLSSEIKEYLDEKDFSKITIAEHKLLDIIEEIENE